MELGMKSVILYFRAIATIAFVAVSLGYIGPFFISLADTFWVAFGFFYLILVVPVVAYLVNLDIINKAFNNVKDI